MVTTRSNQPPCGYARARTGSPPRCYHRASAPALLPPHCYPRTATPAPRTGSTPALLPPRLCPRTSAPALLPPHCYPRAVTPALLPPHCYPRTSAPALAQARRSPSILLPGLAHPLRGRAERSVHAWGCSRTSSASACLGMHGDAPDAEALQYYCQAWLTHCVGEPNAPSMPGDAHARHRLRLTPTRRHVRVYPHIHKHVPGFGLTP